MPLRIKVVIQHDVGHARHIVQIPLATIATYQIVQSQQSSHVEGSASKDDNRPSRQHRLEASRAVDANQCVNLGYHCLVAGWRNVIQPECFVLAKRGRNEIPTFLMGTNVHRAIGGIAKRWVRAGMRLDGDKPARFHKFRDN